MSEEGNKKIKSLGRLKKWTLRRGGIQLRGELEEMPGGGGGGRKLLLVQIILAFQGQAKTTPQAAAAVDVGMTDREWNLFATWVYYVCKNIVGDAYLAVWKEEEDEKRRRRQLQKQ